MKKIYKKQTLIESSYLKVDEVNEIYYERYGDIKKTPVFYIHGGPGGSISKSCTYFFNPKKYHIILFDQRGTGKSKPFLSTHNNNIDYLVEDIEQLRKHLKLNKIILFGGSFGSTLSLAYSIKYPQNVSHMVLRGIFLGRQEDVKWLYTFGASEFFKEEHNEFLSVLNDEDKKDPIKGYYNIFNNDNISEELKNEAYIKFSNYENNIVKITPNIKKYKKGEIANNHQKSIAFFEDYYFQHKTFPSDNNYILNNAYKLKDIKTYIIHGRYDLVCKPSQAYELHKKLPESILTFVKIAGHSSSDKELFNELVKTMNNLN